MKRKNSRKVEKKTWITKIKEKKIIIGAIGLFLVWIIFLDSNSILMLLDLNSEINQYREELSYYQSEYEKNESYYKKMIQNKEEKEKYARENYFMKKPNEEIFIIVEDTVKSSK